MTIHYPCQENLRYGEEVMRIAELSATSGVSTPTIKWYLRMGLLARGVATARNQARYGPEHVRRLRLIQALLDIGGLSVAETQRLLGRIDDPGASLADVMAAAHGALSRDRAPNPTGLGRAVAEAVVRRRGWVVSAEAPARDDLAAALSTLASLSRTGPGAGDGDPLAAIEGLADTIEPYAAAVEALASQEVGTLPFDAPRDEVVERMIIGTVLVERVITSLRRLAQEHYFHTSDPESGRP
jgi:DNA-binding transcriptional MerR regulator